MNSPNLQSTWPGSSVPEVGHRAEYTTNPRIRPLGSGLELYGLRKDGREVLQDIKRDEDLKKIPVVILTTSHAEEDVMRAILCARLLYTNNSMHYFTEAESGFKCSEEEPNNFIKRPPCPCSPISVDTSAEIVQVKYRSAVWEESNIAARYVKNDRHYT